jgi:hypothetical protein
MVLMRTASEPVSAWLVCYALAYGTLCIGVFAWLALRAYQRWEIQS